MTAVEKYIRYLRYEKNYSPHTEISYSTDLAQFQEFIEQYDAGITIDHADEGSVRMWILHLMKGGDTARSVNRKLSALKSFYKFLLRTGAIETNPVKRISGPKAKRPLPSFVNSREMNYMLDSDVVQDDFVQIRNHSIMEVFYATGMRRAELIGLKDADVDFGANVIRVTGKRNKQRLIPFSNQTKQLLQEYMQTRNRTVEQTGAHFFVRPNGEALYPMLVYRIVSAYLENLATLSKTGPHVLRHSFATGMLDNGAELNAVKELLGHASLSATEVYTHTSFEELKKVYNRAHPRA
jgi:integrase/recombinase XerC